MFNEKSICGQNGLENLINDIQGLVNAILLLYYFMVKLLKNVYIPINIEMTKK